MADWKEHLIKTDVDKLLEYIRAEETVSLRDAASALGVDDSTVLDWARSLEDAGMITIGYSARKGKMLRLDTDAETLENKAEDVKDEAGQKMWAAQRWNKEQARLRRFEDALDRLKEQLEKDEKSAAKLREELEAEEADLDDIITSTEDMEEAEEELEQLREDLKDIKKDLAALEQLEQHREVEEGGTLSGVTTALKSALPFGTAERTGDAEDEEVPDAADETPDEASSEDTGGAADEAGGGGGPVSMLKGALPFGGADVDYDEIVAGTVDEVKEAVRENDLDAAAVLEAERAGKDRKTLKDWLQQRTDEDTGTRDDADDGFDYARLADMTVEEAKETVREHELDAEQALAVEEEHGDRKTLKEWLQRRIDADDGADG